MEEIDENQEKDNFYGATGSLLQWALEVTAKAEAERVSRWLQSLPPFLRERWQQVYQKAYAAESKKWEELSLSADPSAPTAAEPE
jgi:hypothetical protein